MKAYLRCQSSVAGTGRLSAGSASTNTLTKPSQEPEKRRGAGFCTAGVTG